MFIMDWLIKIFQTTDSVAHISLLYSLVIALGVLLGKIKIGGISLGVTFILFTGLLFGHIRFTAPTNILTFVQDFGLILFVFSIGLQVGPGFFASFRNGGGIKLNLLSVLLICLNIIVMFACYYLLFDTSNPVNLPMMVGTLYGAVTNTPALGAASETLTHFFSPGNVPQIAAGYACAYPLGVLGIISATIAIRYICGVNLKEDEDKLINANAENLLIKPFTMHLKVSNSYLHGRTLLQITDFLKRDFVCTRILHDGVISIPSGNTNIELGDEVLITCAEADKEPIQVFFGSQIESEWTFEDEKQPLVSRRVVVTNSNINGKVLGEMHLANLYGVNITRLTRQGLDLFASRNIRLQIGDRVMVVGPEDRVERVAKLLGNSVKRLNFPNLFTIFIGIVVGIIFGSIPISIPGIPVPLNLGLAGGPLVVAILIGRFGYKLRLVTYTTTSANMMIREIGLALFLASVGIKAGAGFWDTIIQGDGFKYVYTGFLITVIPILIVGVIARMVYKFNYFTLMGMLAGTYTDPPALAYANSNCATEAPGVGYSTVYPLCMFLRIFTAQLIILFCCG